MENKIKMRNICIPLMLALTAGLSANNPPNVIYILADDLGYGDLSCYGQTKFQTPNIDRLAAEGIKFTNHYSGNTVCSPSRAVLMTGQPTGKCYIRGNFTGNEAKAALEPEWTTLPEIFKAAGYATGAYGKWGLGITNTTDAQNPLMHGFDEFCGWKNQVIAHTYYPTSYVLNGEEIPLDGKTYVHDIIMDKAFLFIENNAKAQKPFFCYIPTAIPHAAMHAPSELHEKWRKVFPQFDNIIGKYNAGRGEKCPDVVNPIAGFAAMMEHLDNQVGELLEMLHTLGIDDNTIIMFASDNGPHKEGGHDPKFWNSTGGLRGGKRDMHEGGIRSPMLVRWPGVIKAGSVTNHISAFHDVVPTVADLLNQPFPPEAEGISFLPTLKGDSQKAHDAIYIEFHKGKDMFSQAVRMGKWKAYIEEGKWELFNLDADPYEKRNIANQHPDIIKQIKSAISTMKDDTRLRTINEIEE
jgi:arylsulfatase A-like enzyme